MDWKNCFVVMGAIIPEPEGMSTNSRPDWSTTYIDQKVSLAGLQHQGVSDAIWTS